MTSMTSGSWIRWRLGLDDLAGKHSNTQIPKVIGCARRYELTADERDKRIAESFWSIVVSEHSYATGRQQRL